MDGFRLRTRGGDAASTLAAGIRAGLALLCVCFVTSAFGWSRGHVVISSRLTQLLPDEDKALFGEELTAYATHHCLIPDFVPKKDGTEHYVWDFVGETLTDYSDPRFERFHLFYGATDAYELLESYIRRAGEAGREGRTHDFACLVGVLSHMLEDWTCPPHCTGNDNMMGLLQSYLPPPARMENAVVHWSLETSDFDLDDITCTPSVIAATPGELAWRLIARVERDHLAARASIVPMLQDVYRKDQKACDAKQKPSGARGLLIVADAVRTIGAMVRAKGPLPDGGPVSLADVMPREAVGLVYLQNAYFWDPYWGKPSKDCTYRDGKEKLPLAVTQGGKRVEVKGLGFGSKSYSWDLPKGVFRRLTALCGLHADLAEKGSATVAVSVNGRDVAAFSLKGTEEAKALDIALPADATNFAVRVTGDRNARKTYFVLGNPELRVK